MTTIDSNASDSALWDPTVLRKYTSTGHFRLLNQVRTELKANPLVRPGEGESVADVNRSRALLRALQPRAGSGGRSRRSPRPEAALPPPLPMPAAAAGDDPSDDAASSASFRERLRAIDMR
ncbi:MAG: hypothetical protein ACKOPN_04370 [Prochlorococcaceae cyanobacterium]